MRHIATRLARRLQLWRARNGAHGAILIYHRVAEPAADPWNMAVSPKNFTAHLDILKGYATAQTMGELAAGLTDGKRARSTFAITFDDGYLDNLSTALPILEAHDVSATVFVVSRAIGRPDAFWWDLLTRVFLEVPQLPERLYLTNGDASQKFDLGGDAAYDADGLARAADWRAEWTAPQDRRQQVFLDLWKLMLSLSPDAQSVVAKDIARWAGLDRMPAPQEISRPMNLEELSRLAASPLIEIGGHTASHPDLSRTTDETAFADIAEGRHALMEVTGGPIDCFAYPYGRSSATTATTIKQVGFRFAGCSRPWLATSAANPFELPRIQVPNLAPDAFERLLQEFLGPSSRDVNGARVKS
jgi:peptidoglycan/xylan/chitin deacetylase (PgdA/CDA1 family)